MCPSFYVYVILIQGVQPSHAFYKDLPESRIWEVIAIFPFFSIIKVGFLVLLEIPIYSAGKLIKKSKLDFHMR